MKTENRSTPMRRIIGDILLAGVILLIADVVFVMQHRINAVVLISSNCHMDRAVKTAKSAGFSEILRLPAPSSLLHYGANVMSEVVLELNEFTLKK